MRWIQTEIAPLSIAPTYFIFLEEHIGIMATHSYS